MPNEIDKPNGKDGASGETTGKIPDSLASTEEKTPFQRFEDFARRVISVPRSEIEEREQEYRDNRPDRPRKISGP